MLALDGHGYEIPAASDGKTQTTRENLVRFILDKQLAGGGWNFSGTAADVDMTAMVLQALAPYYKTNTEVRTAVDTALAQCCPIVRMSMAAMPAMATRTVSPTRRCWWR